MSYYTAGNDTLSELLDFIDPEMFLEYEGVDFKRSFGSSGAQLNIKICPRCGGCAWKVYLNADSGLGNCFHGSCVGEAGYNLFSFARALWGISAGETIERLKRYSKEQGWVAKRTVSADVELVDVDVELPDYIVLPYKGINLRYLTDRGISIEITKYFNVRYCHRGEYVYYDAVGTRYRQNYDRRIIIPIFDLNGKLVTFQGRDITGAADRKYLFPSGLPGTARFLYNAHNVIGLESIVMCEGVIDVWSTKMALDEDVALREVGQIGSFGKKLSHGSSDGSDQLGDLIRLKALGLKTVVIMWDGEIAALRSAIDAGKLIIGIGLRAKIALLPEDKDPNEAAPVEVRQAYYSALPANSFLLMKKMITRTINSR